MVTCRECNKKIKRGYFRCDDCASKAIIDPTKKNMPVGGATLWRKSNGFYTPRP